jgi:hypothetical protein
LHTTNESSYVLNSWGIFNVQSERLAFYTSLIYQYPSVRGKAGVGEADMGVDHRGFSDGPTNLQLRRSFTLYGQNSAIISQHTHNGGAFAHGLLRVLHLEKMAIR